MDIRCISEYTVSQKVPTFKHSVTLSNPNRVSKFCTAGNRMKFATKLIWHRPPHLRHVATIPWEIKNSNFCRYSADMEEHANKFHLITSNFVIRPQILIFSLLKNGVSFPILIANKIFHVTVLLVIYFCGQFVATEIRHNRRQCLSTINMIFSDEGKIF